MEIESQTRTDLREDFEEIEYLYECLEENLEKFSIEIKKAKKYIAEKNYELGLKYSEILRKEISLPRSHLDRLVKERPFPHIDELRDEKYRQQELLRFYYASIGSLITSTDWQSPSYTHSLVSKAGRQSGQITGTINDYKRDVHLDEKKYEQLFLKEYIDAKLKLFLKAYLVNSGQAAFQTILTFLMSEKKLTGKVLCGKSSYFQYKQILTGVFGKKLISVNENETDEILKRVQDDDLDAIFLDSLCNSPNLARPDLTRIFDFIYKNAGREIYLVIDNTCLSVSCQPFLMRGRNKKVHLITFESLNKYYQFGLDRVTAGIIICQNSDAGGIFEYRKHAGTNITDSSFYALPVPNRKLLTRRLMRHQRNALILAEYLDLLGNEKINKIVYPEIKSYPFSGSFFNIELIERYNTPLKMNKLIRIIINEAKKQKINITGGTSFGLNTTRIYLTSLWSKFGQPFLRISVGTEDIEEVEKMKAVFENSISKI